MQKYLKYFLIILAINCVLIFNFYKKNKIEGLEVYYLDVGQGDSILIRTPDNQNILIDGGPDEAILQRLGEILPSWDKNIELMILTHPHDDHIIGLIKTLEKYEVHKIIYNPTEYYNPNYEKFMELIKEKNITQQAGYYHDKININQNSYLEILYPIKNEKKENLNNTSIITRLVFKKNKFLFTGDAEQEVEEELLENNIDLQANVLKIGHHGSKTASSSSFLDSVYPKIAITSCGLDNKFHHPHFSTLYSLQKRKIQIFRTDQDKTVKCSANGFDVQCQKML